ncbi:MAG: tyrosine-type recombinase/integrase [Myxococcota bacterium]
MSSAIAITDGALSLEAPERAVQAPKRASHPAEMVLHPNLKAHLIAPGTEAPTFGALVEEMLAEDRRAGYRSADEFRSAVSFFTAAVGGLPVDQLDTPILSAWARWACSRTRADGEKYSPSRILGWRWAARRVVRRVLELGYLTEDPFAHLPRSAWPTKKLRPEFRPHVETLPRLSRLALSESVDAVSRTFYAVLIAAGVRMGEGLGLQFKDWSRSTRPLGTLHVRRTWNSHTKAVGETKTGATRRIPVHPALAGLLEHWAQRGWRRAHGRAPTKTDFLFPSPQRAKRDHRPRSQSYVQARFQRHLALVGLPPMRLHDIRHSFITAAAEVGISEAARLWTHAKSARSSADIYSHPGWDWQCAQMRRMRLPFGRSPEQLELFP